jgi:hypothetical protein
LEHSFPVDRTRLVGGIYVTIYFSLKHIIAAASFVRTHGASYLRALSISDVIELLTDFVKDNYQPVAGETLFKRLDGPFADHLSENAKEQLAAAIGASPLFQPENVTTLFPLVTVKVETDFSSPPFFFRAPATMLEELPTRLHPRLAPDTFPPLLEHKYRQERPASWLGIRSPSLASSQKMLRGILGALALTPSHTYRHMFSGRQVWGGHWTVGGGLSFSDAVTPPIVQDIVLTGADGAWLEILANKISAEARPIRRQITALEYYYRAWLLPPSERFPILCMVLDAVYGDAQRATAAVIEGIQATVGPLDHKRLRDLMDIRNAVIHGGAPDVYDSRKYGKYYRQHGEDPIRDLGLVAAACLRRTVFGTSLIEHPEPHQDIIEKAKAAGRMPRKPRATILDGASVSSTNEADT